MSDNYRDGCSKRFEGGPCGDRWYTWLIVQAVVFAAWLSDPLNRKKER